MRISDGDPLDIAGRIKGRTDHHALLIDPERVLITAQARVAHDAASLAREGCFAPGQELRDFLTSCVDRALQDTLNEDIEDEHSGMPEMTPCHPAHEFLGGALGIEVPQIRKAILVFNHLAWDTRRAFCSVMLEGKTLNRWVAEGHGPLELAKARIAYAFAMLGS